MQIRLRNYVEKLMDYAQESLQHEDPLDQRFEVSEVVTICKKLPNGKAAWWFRWHNLRAYKIWWSHPA